MDWTTVPIPVLHRYRHAYRLRVPSASPFYNHLILSQGIGKRAPSRAGYTFTAHKRRQGQQGQLGQQGQVNPAASGGAGLGLGLARGESGLSEGSFEGEMDGAEGGGGGGGAGAGGGGQGGGASGAGVGVGRRGRCTREQLATVVRKNFNAQPISESDVIVNFLYSVKNQGEFWFLGVMGGGGNGRGGITGMWANFLCVLGG